MVVQRKRELLLDVVPEHYPYKDDGCEVSASCLRCPLPRCKYDDPGWLQRTQRQRRDTQLLRAHREEKLPVAELAARFHVSQRTVWRVLQRERNGAQS
jgi:hypothetical protein